MKKLFSLLAIVIGVVAFTSFTPSFAQTTYKIQSKAPYISESMKPIINKYRSEDYLGAMLDLENLLKVEKNNTTAKYYLALCYTRLGYRSEAEAIYNEVVNLNDNLTLVYYAKKALACIDNPENQDCVSLKNGFKKDDEKKTEEVQAESDISRFIKSGERIHPSAMDRIIQERMERRIQEEAAKAQQENLQSAVPTNEEIASALQTLAKVGINPYNQNMGMLSLMQSPYQAQFSNPYMMMQNGYTNNQDLAKLMLYSQMNSHMSQFYGL